MGKIKKILAGFAVVPFLLVGCDGSETPEFEKPEEHICSFSDEWVVVMEGGCHQREIEARYCTGCGAEERREGNFKHQYVTVSKLDPTCTTTGHNEYQRCEGCGDVVGFVSYDTVSHNFGEWKTISERSCADYGVKERYCQNEGCYHYERQEEAPLGHSYVSEVIERTELTSGYTKFTCQTCGDNYKDDELGPLLYFYEYKSGELEVNATYEGDVSHVKEITIPDMYDGKVVTKIGSFTRFSNLEKVTIESNGKKDFTYGSCAFENLTNLKEVTIIDGGVVENRAFKGCTSFDSDDLTTLKSIGDYAFSNCTSLKSFNAITTAALKVESVGNGAFYGCSSLTELYLPQGSLNAKLNVHNQVEGHTLASYVGSITSLTTLNLIDLREIGVDAFKGFSSLTTIHVYPHEGLLIDSSAFEGCSGLTYLNEGNGKYVKLGENWALLEVTDKTVSSFELLSGVTVISSKVFEGMENLTTVTFANSSVLSIGANAFKDCLRLTNIPLGAVRVIGANAFENCKSLNYVQIYNLREVKDNAFLGCTNLVAIRNNSALNLTKGTTDHGYIAYYALNIGETVQAPQVSEDGFVTYTYSDVTYLLGYNGTNTEITIPSEVDVIKAYSIYSNVTKLTVNETVSEIEENAFRYASELESLIVPFVGTKRVDSVSNTDKTCMWYVFGSANVMWSHYYYIPQNLKYVEITGNSIIPANAFKIEVDEKYPVNIEEIVISGTPEQMGQYIFYYKLPAKLTLPYLGQDINTANTLNYAIYSGNQVMTELRVTAGKVAEEAFRNATLDMLYLGDNVVLEKDAFKWTTGIKAISIPKGFESFNTNSAFLLENIYYRGTLSEYFEYGYQVGKGLNNGSVNNVSYDHINYYFLDDNNEYYLLKEVTLPNSFTVVKEGQFRGFELDKLVIPSTVTTIESYSLNSCKIKDIIIPSSVTSIGSYAFSSSDYIQNIYFEGTEEAWKAMYTGELYGINVVFNYVIE